MQHLTAWFEANLCKKTFWGSYVLHKIESEWSLSSQVLLVDGINLCPWRHLRGWAATAIAPEPASKISMANVHPKGGKLIHACYICSCWHHLRIQFTNLDSISLILRCFGPVGGWGFMDRVHQSATLPGLHQLGLSSLIMENLRDGSQRWTLIKKPPMFTETPPVRRGSMAQSI